MKILIAETNFQMRDLHAFNLKLRGHQVTELSSGDAVLAMLNDDPSYDALLTANALNGKSGLKVLEELRADERFSKLRVVMYSGDTDRSVANKVKELGGTYLSKYHYDVLEALHEVTKS